MAAAKCQQVATLLHEHLTSAAIFEAVRVCQRGLLFKVKKVLKGESS
jgi:hypothetical protein